MPARPRPVLLALTAALALSACSSGGSDSPAGPATPATPVPSSAAPVPTSPTPTSAAPSSAAPSPAAYTYVALGDSYTAAPLVPDTDAADPCLQSSNDYPHLVARERPGTRLIDVSCSGASSRNGLTGPQVALGATLDPQDEALTRGTDLVTLGMGGNDFDLFTTLVGTCSRLGPTEPSGSPCRDLFTAGGTDRLRPLLGRIATRIRQDVVDVRRRSPQARILVLGYPQLVPATGSCPDLLPVADGDLPFVRSIAAGLSNAVARGARAADVGAEYVDVASASRGHDICAAVPWVNGQSTDPAAALAFHPFAREQRAVAGLVERTLKAGA